MRKTMIRYKSTNRYYLILAVIAMTSLVACTKLEDTAPPRKITFDKATYRPQTKAGEVSVMDEFAFFKCMAFLHADGYQRDNQTQFFFGPNGETIYAYNSNNQVWTSGNVAYWAPSHDYYWPKSKDSYINFVGWYDTQANSNFTVEETTTSGVSSTQLKWTDYIVAANDNILYADEAWRYNENPQSSYHLDNEGSSYKAVPMLFHHALSKLCINAKVTETEAINVTGGTGTENPNGKTTWTVTLSDITLSGVHNKGSLTLQSTDPESTGTTEWTVLNVSATDAEIGWVHSDSAPDPIVIDDPEQPLTKNAVDILSMHSVLPQKTDDIELSFYINIVTTYSFIENGVITDSFDYSIEKIHKTVSLSEAIDSWKMNKKITYTISINPVTTLVRIDPAMVDWVTGTGGSSSF